MKTRILAVSTAAVLAIGLAGCHHHSRKATESTGTATATVKTTAPNSVVSDSQLQSQAEHAADAASAPVNGLPSNTTNAAPANATTK